MPEATMTTSATVPSAGQGSTDLLLDVRNVTQEFVLRNHGGVKGGILRAVSDVSFQMHAGETLGIVGETGSGKSTLARSVLQAPPPKSGEVVFRGQDLTKLKRKELLAMRQHVQMVFQDPPASLDPKWKVTEIVEEPLIAFGYGDKAKRRSRVAELLELVGLDPRLHGGRKPRELSGGQCQRVAIARAIALHPELVVCDEAVSSLDVLVQAQVLNLFERLRADLGLSYLFIAHDLALVKQVSDRVLVLYLGKLCEVGPSDAMFKAPAHPYTLALLASVPSPDPNAGRPETAKVISGELPSPLNPPSGCRFRTRCPRAEERCALEEPQLRPVGPGHQVACHYPLVETPVAASTSHGAATNGARSQSPAGPGPGPATSER